MSKLAAACAAALLSVGAFATDSGSGTMGVTASIAEECSVGNTVTLDFGQLSMLSNGAASSAPSASVAGGTLDAICTSGTTTPKLKFSSANSNGTDFRLVGADATTYIVYTLAESGGAAIAYNTAASFTGFAADGSTKSLAIAGSIAATEKTGKAKQAYSDTITITSTYGI
ncbi:spore coat protein U domain-containing protein [Ramlibacter sp. AN1133]|uniref:spore coat protein U domain-containing protein n=1 Tax=Ramlibacter sp. AN1133 TaxID=3133429 RepID=UPI0030C1DF06